MREQRYWYLCCTATRPLDSRTWPRKSAETAGLRFRSKSCRALAKWSMTLHPFIYAPSSYLPGFSLFFSSFSSSRLKSFGAGGCVAKYQRCNLAVTYSASQCPTQATISHPSRGLSLLPASAWGCLQGTLVPYIDQSTATFVSTAPVRYSTRTLRLALE
ncbi:hypothetical protein GGI35DRAFT_395686 [Trichoderma velutinum]